MTRLAFRNFWLIVVALLLIAAFFVMRKGQEHQGRITRATGIKERLTLDLRAGSQRSAALAALDKLTIDEANATRLDILRHLNLEKSDLTFNLTSKSVRKVGPVDLYIRNFTLLGSDVRYGKALETIDWLNSTNKVAVNSVLINAGSGYEDSTAFTVSGILYGLDKENVY